MSGRKEDVNLAASCFDEHMKYAIERVRPFLVDHLEVTDLLDHLLGTVFPCISDIQAENTREEKVRKLLDRLIKRPAAAFWIFIEALFQPRVGQGHLALRILEEYSEHGGVIPERVERLRRDHF
ncbi:uncharacterized protein LOC143282109 [Babylonia areolata]|uniref:uncharacterized protein LOC143282109 n=1 Tax=Babylonia areolata TaxID=304850 RepID=UPI003FD3F22D